MTVPELLELLRGCPLVASVQAADGSPVQEVETLTRLAMASKREGVRLLRLQGAEAIAGIREATGLPCIGLIKRSYPDSEIYITATCSEVEEVLSAGAEIVALDATRRTRPHGEQLRDLVSLAHGRGALVLADVDSVESALYAEECGADLVSTTLSGYTKESPSTQGPDLSLLREVIARVTCPVFAEGRIEEPWHVEVALRMGAAGVIVGGALNDPEKNTRRFMPKARPTADVGAVDIGGTWIRFATFAPDWKLREIVRARNPVSRLERLDWIRQQVASSGVGVLGVGTGGIVDPETGEVWTAKEYLMPDHIGIRFDESTLGVPTYAHGDGHATAWGHACLPQFAGSRVATLTLGTGVGCGFVVDHRIWSGRRGEYPRINDLPAPGGMTYEDLLGGINLGLDPTAEQKEKAVTALQGAVSALRGLYFPDHIVISGSVGSCEWLSPAIDEVGAVLSPFGSDAGLYGAAALALFPSYR
jgi:putative N-acetylmannosamine-6-phosphate epimerase